MSAHMRREGERCQAVHLQRFALVATKSALLTWLLQRAASTICAVRTCSFGMRVCAYAELHITLVLPSTHHTDGSQLQPAMQVQTTRIMNQNAAQQYNISEKVL